MTLKKCIPLSLAAFVVGLGFTACQRLSSTAAGGIDVSLMDKTVRPQDDFYNFVNETWMKNTKISDDKTHWGSPKNFV